MSADAQRRGLQTFSSIIGGHSEEGTEHAIMGESGGGGGGFNLSLLGGECGSARAGYPQQAG